MFRYKKSVGGSYDWQGYVYFASRLFSSMSKEKQDMILQLCSEAGSEYEKALFEFVTQDTTATAVCLKHNLSRAQLYRLVSAYYKNFPKTI